MHAGGRGGHSAAHSSAGARQLPAQEGGLGAAANLQGCDGVRQGGERREQLYAVVALDLRGAPAEVRLAGCIMPNDRGTGQAVGKIERGADLKYQ